MSTPTTTSPGLLPDYIASAKPNPPTNRGPWYKNTAPTYAGIFLWFIFWDSIRGQGTFGGRTRADFAGDPGGGPDLPLPLLPGSGPAGQEDGVALYIVGTSTFGALGGLFMPGLLMGALQFGWLGVNTFGAAEALAKGFNAPWLFYPLCVIWAGGGGLRRPEGHPVRGQGRHLPAAHPVGGAAAGPGALWRIGLQLHPPAEAAQGGGATAAILLMIAGIVGFFATAGAAGVDFGTNSRDDKDVQMGGYVGIIAAILLTAGMSAIAVAGAGPRGSSIPTHL